MCQTMQTNCQLDRLWTIEIACQRCIRAAKSFDALSNTNTNAWAFTQNCFGGICVIHWCQVFGAESEPTHYSRLFDKSTMTQMTKDIVKGKLRKTLGMTESEYLNFWQGVKDARDKFLVHCDFAVEDKPIFPDTDHLLKTCFVMRDILAGIVATESFKDTKRCGDILHFMVKYTNERFLSEVDRDVALLSRAVSGHK